MVNIHESSKIHDNFTLQEEKYKALFIYMLINVRNTLITCRNLARKFVNLYANQVFALAEASAEAN